MTLYFFYFSSCLYCQPAILFLSLSHSFSILHTWQIILLNRDNETEKKCKEEERSSTSTSLNHILHYHGKKMPQLVIHAIVMSSSQHQKETAALTWTQRAQILVCNWHILCNKWCVILKKEVAETVNYVVCCRRTDQGVKDKSKDQHNVFRAHGT